MPRDPAERKALRRLKTQQEESHNRPQRKQTRTKLEVKIIALVKALARQAAEADVRAERERENGRVQ
ncbi:MAG: hypothetical protein IPH06_13535 [Alphaproteobacteria bacterium]|nr:hypothetical protein [Alphaproteobacteria bacterium]QQS56473.1 MAG: hypothetical protein IPN28_09285 [Alphaproteobacteria bacterium]